jgi:hypothetical protein
MRCRISASVSRIRPIPKVSSARVPSMCQTSLSIANVMLTNRRLGLDAVLSLSKHTLRYSTGGA